MAIERRTFLKLGLVGALGIALGMKNESQEVQAAGVEVSHCIAKNYNVDPKVFGSQISEINYYKLDSKGGMSIFSVAEKPDRKDQIALWNDIVDKFWNLKTHREIWRGYESKYGGFDVPADELTQVALIQFSRQGSEEKPDYLGFYKASSKPLEIYVFPWTWQNYTHPFSVNGKHYGIHPCGSGAIWIGEFKDLQKILGD